MEDYLHGDPFMVTVDWIKANPEDVKALGLVKLILSLWDQRACFSFRECIQDFDFLRLSWAMSIIFHVVQFGTDTPLEFAGRYCAQFYPAVFEEGIAGHVGKEEMAQRLDYRHRKKKANTEKEDH